MTASTLLSTDDVAPRERAPAWREWVFQHFGGLDSGLDGDTDFEGHMAASHAGDVILTKLEANRHRAMRMWLEGCVRELSESAPAGRPITEIALSWGFSNLSHFSRVFREHCGMCASEYRQQRG